LKSSDKNWLLVKKIDGQEHINNSPEATFDNVFDKDLKSPMPREIRPMLAKLSDNKPFDDPDWFFEIKWDGYRAIAEIEDGRARLYSRNNQTLDAQFPEIFDALTQVEYNVVFDGEIVALDENGVSNFQFLQNYKRFGTGHLVYM